ncbi:hypothetical protein VZT92_027890 [Zoarces viviparus]|uniref:Uncharacterized protein n=1 Tax=Zoarces viviparus TaxID=48416 RepID=A0AAW1DXH7_ZOAVI
MTSVDLCDTLVELKDDEFKEFTWLLQQHGFMEPYPAIKESKLEKANRLDTVDLMVKTFELHGALKVTRKVLQEISRNDLLQSLPNTSSGPEEMKVPHLILDSLDQLGADDFKRFQWNLTEPVLDGCWPIPKSRLENKDRPDTVSSMMDSYGEESAVNVTVEILKRMNLNNEAEKLQNSLPAAQNPPPTPSSSSSSSGWTPAAGATVSAQHGSVIVAPSITGSSAGSVNININTQNDSGDADSKLDVKTNVPDKEFQAPFSFKPEHTADSSYRFRCPGPGVFQCSVTGLVFVMAQEAELLYRMVQWDEGLLQPAGKKAAGPLFNIKSSEDAAVCQLHLPHCETKDALVFDGLLSVVHITDDGMTILEPLEVTDTHVVVKVPNLSTFGLVWDYVRRFLNIRLPIKGQVLLFLRPPLVRDQILDVFLLQDNIPMDEVPRGQPPATYIRISSECDRNVYVGKSYHVHCEPEGFHIQPEGKLFDSSYGPNFHPTFEVFLTLNTTKVTLSVQDEERKAVWKRLVSLEGPRAEIQQRNPGRVPAQDRVPAEQMLLSVRTQFVNRVSDSVLNQLLDKLLEHRVITDAEMQTTRTKHGADKARDVIDTVRRKGSEACSVLIAALREVDEWLYTALNLS